MKANQEHLDNLALVARYKEANKNTIHKSVYDPARKLYVLVPVQIDPNAYTFAKEIIVSEAKAKRKVKNGVTNASEAGKTARNYVKSPEMQENVVRLIDEGKSVKEIAVMYGVGERSVSRHYKKLKNDDIN